MEEGTVEQINEFRKRAKVMQRINCTIVTLLNVVLIIFLAHYAYKNPDIEAIFAEVNYEPGMFTAE